MDIDLNLEPFVHPPQDDHPHSITLFDDLLHGSTVSHHLLPLAAASGAAASVAAGNNKGPPEPLKTDENDNESSFFDCNICLDLASDPVVTCCGHLFCWPCIYRWLFVHSSAKQCPICKGEVTMKTITPIYSRNRPNATKVLDPHSSFKIPCRPLANRIESWRQSFQRDTLNFPILDMVRRLESNRFSLYQDPMSSNSQEIPSTHLLNRIFTSRGIRRGRDSVPSTAPEVTVDLVNDYVPDLTSAESFVDSYFRDHPDERSQDELALIDGHSMSSVGGIIMQSEVGTGLRRRRDPSTSRVLDVDRGNSRPRRRRLQ